MKRSRSSARPFEALALLPADRGHTHAYPNDSFRRGATLSPKAVLRVLVFGIFGMTLLSPELRAVSPTPTYTTYPCPISTTNCEGGSARSDLQVRVSERSARNTCAAVDSFGNCFGNTAQGTCPGFQQWCQSTPDLSPGILSVSQTGTSNGDIQLDIEYEFPNGYCQTWDPPSQWPVPGSNHNTNIDLTDAGGTIVSTRAVFEHGRWRPTIACSAGQQLTIRARRGCGTPQTFDFLYTVGACPARKPDRGTCPSGGRGAGTGVGQPINVGSGDVSTSIPLFALQQQPLPLDFTLSYHSLPPTYATVTLPEPLGKGWTHPCNQVLKAIPATSPQRLLHYTADGREFEFTQSGGVWNASLPAEARGTVTLAAGEYSLTDLDGTVTHFDEATGRWKRTTDRWGNRIEGTYDGSGRLATIKDSVDRVLTLTYSGSVIQSISVPEAPAPRVWTFSYNGGATLLFGIRDPLHAGSDWRSLAYSAKGFLASIRDDASKVLEGHTYEDGDFGRGLTSYSDAGSKNLVSVEYDTPTVGTTRVRSRIDGSTTQTSSFVLAYQGGRWLPTQIVGPCSTCGGASGDTQSFTYTADNHTDTITDGKGNVTKFVYNADGNVTSMKDAFGTGLERETTWLYAYAPWPTFWTTKTEPSVVSGLKTTTRTWGGGETTLTVDEAGKLVGGASETHTTVQTFDAKHRLLTVNGPLAGSGDTTTYAYFADAPVSNDAGRLSSVTDPVSLQAAYASYDIFGTARTETAPDGVVTTLQTDARGRNTQRAVAPLAGDPDVSTYTTVHEFDTRDRLIKTTMPLGNAIQYVYEDGTNRLLQTIRLSADGKQQERLLFTLNDIGGKTREEAQACTVPAVSCAAWTTRRSDKYTFDSKNRLQRVVHPVPLPADSTFVEYAYDANGQLASVRDERHGSPNTTYTPYDALNRLVTVTQTLAGEPGNQITTTYGYDKHDNLTSVTDPNGNVTLYEYDDFRRLGKQTSPVSGMTTYAYDLAGNLTSQTDANGAVTSRVYDAASRLLTATSTRAGRPTEIVTNTWGTSGTPIYSKGRLVNLKVEEDAAQKTATSYGYDRRGLARSEAHDILGNAYSLAYVYDANGNRTRVTYPSGRNVDTTYDFADRPSGATSGATTYVSSATYEPFGPQKDLVFGNGTTRSATWDLRYLPATLQQTGGSLGSSVSYTYGVDALGNITSITDNGNAAYNRTFTYDDLNRLKDANTSTSGTPPLWGTGSYGYDALGNRKTLTLGARSVSYAYDVVATKTTSRLKSTTEASVVTNLVRDVTGNETAVGPLSSLYSSRNSLRATGLGAFLYDGRGVRVAEDVASGGRFFPVTPCRVIDTRNPDGPYGGPHIAANSSRTFSIWNQCGIDGGARALALNTTVASPTVNGELTLFPADVAKPTASALSMTAAKTRANNGVMGLSLLGDLTIYNASADPAQTILDVAGFFKEVSSAKRYFFYSPELSLLTETNQASGTAPTPLWEYVWFGGRPVAQEKVGDATALRYTTTDHLGTPFLQTNAAGAAAWRAEYEPYGNVFAYRAGSASDYQPLRLPGQEERSQAPGRNYNVFRWYRPDVGLYTQQDPASNPFAVKEGTFTFVAGNPIVLRDPLGLSPCGPCCESPQQREEDKRRLLKAINRALLAYNSTHLHVPQTQCETFGGIVSGAIGKAGSKCFDWNDVFSREKTVLRFISRYYDEPAHTATVLRPCGTSEWSDGVILDAWPAGILREFPWSQWRPGGTTYTPIVFDPLGGGRGTCPQRP